MAYYSALCVNFSKKKHLITKGTVFVGPPSINVLNEYKIYVINKCVDIKVSNSYHNDNEYKNTIKNWSQIADCNKN